MGSRPRWLGQIYNYHNFKEQSEEIILVTKLGNCWEKGTVYAYYALQHANIAPSNAYRCTGTNGCDHVWCVLTTNTLIQGNNYTFADIGLTGVVLDGWTEDWWFPNVGPIDRTQVDCWRMAGVFALGVRAKIQYFDSFLLQTS